MGLHQWPSFLLPHSQRVRSGICPPSRAPTPRAHSGPASAPYAVTTEHLLGRGLCSGPVGKEQADLRPLECGLGEPDIFLGWVGWLPAEGSWGQHQEEVRWDLGRSYSGSRNRGAEVLRWVGVSVHSAGAGLGAGRQGHRQKPWPRGMGGRGQTPQHPGHSEGKDRNRSLMGTVGMRAGTPALGTAGTWTDPLVSCPQVRDLSERRGLS